MQNTSRDNHVMIDKLYDQVKEQLHSQQKSFDNMTDKMEFERKNSSEPSEEMKMQEESQID